MMLIVGDTRDATRKRVFKKIENEIGLEKKIKKEEEKMRKNPSAINIISRYHAPYLLSFMYIIREKRISKENLSQLFYFQTAMKKEKKSFFSYFPPKKDTICAGCITFGNDKFPFLLPFFPL
jgi:hypothetical protein